MIVSTAKDLTTDERAGLSGMVAGILQKSPRGVDELLDQIRLVLDGQSMVVAAS